MKVFRRLPRVRWSVLNAERALEQFGRRGPCRGLHLGNLPSQRVGRERLVQEGETAGRRGSRHLGPRGRQNAAPGLKGTYGARVDRKVPVTTESPLATL